MYFDVITRQVTELGQYLPIFKIFKGEKLEVSNANSTILQFIVSVGDNVEIKAEYSFNLLSMTKQNKYIFCCTKSNKNINVVVCEDSNYIYICLVSTRKNTNFYVKITQNTNTYVFYKCQYETPITPTTIKYPYNDINIVEKNNENSFVGQSNCIIGKEVTNTKFLNFAVISNSSKLCKKIESGQTNWAYGELVVYVGGLFSTTKSKIIRINIITQNVSTASTGMKITELLKEDGSTIKITVSHDENNIYLYANGDNNSRLTVSVLSCNMFAGSCKIVNEVVDSVKGTIINT